MTGQTTLRAVCKRSLIVFACLWLLAGSAVAGVTGIGGQAATATTHTIDRPAVDSVATSTTVNLDPSSASVDEDEKRTFSVIVSDADGGVGAVSGSIAVAEHEHAVITDFNFDGSPGAKDVNISDSQVEFEAALMDTAQTGEVAVAEVTVRGQAEGRTDLSLSINSLGDESGNTYDVGGTPDTALTVENSRNEVPLSISVTGDRPADGESVTFTVMRADSDAPVEANVTVGDRTVGTGVDGEATIVVRESMISDAGTITAIASKDPTSQEQYANDSITVEYDDTSESTSNRQEGETSGVIVRTDPESVNLTTGETTTINVVANVDGEVGAGNLTATVSNPDIVSLEDASVVGDPDIGGAEVQSDNGRIHAEFALRDATDESPVRVLTLSLRGKASGTVTLSLAVSSLGGEDGNSYEVTSTPDTSIDVRANNGNNEATASDESESTAGESADQQANDSSPDTESEGENDSGPSESRTTSPSSDNGLDISNFMAGNSLLGVLTAVALVATLLFSLLILLVAVS